MSPTPATMAIPTLPAAYAWEATDEQVAARYGVPIEAIARFDLNTSPAPPDAALRLLRAGDYGRAISEYPPSDYRELVAAAAERYGVDGGDVLGGAGADEILDLLAKAFIAPGASAVIPTPTYAMYRVLTEQRPARATLVPRAPADRGYALDAGAIRGAAREAALVWLCDPNNPTGLAEPDGAIADLLAGLLADAEAEGRVAPVVVMDEAYAEFVDRSHVALRARYPRLVVVRTASKAYALAGMRVGFAIARPELIAEVAPYRPRARLRSPRWRSSRPPSATPRPWPRTSPGSRASGFASPRRSPGPGSRRVHRSPTSSSSTSAARRPPGPWPTGSCPGASSPARSAPTTRWQDTCASPSATRPRTTA